MRLRVAPLTVAGLLALGAINAWLLTLAVRGRDTVNRDPVMNLASSLSLDETNGAPPANRPAAVYRETLAHPVFYKSREPFIPPPPPPPPTAAKPAPPPVPADPGIMLGGVAINGTVRKAYLFSKTNPQGTWVSLGETFIGWTVHAIEPGAAKLKQSDRELAVELYPRR
jgi:hypothetical protein